MRGTCQERAFKNKTKGVTDTGHKMQTAHTGPEFGLSMRETLTTSDIAMVFYAMHESSYYFFQMEYPAVYYLII